MLESCENVERDRCDAFALLHYHLVVRKVEPLGQLADVVNSLIATLDSSDKEDQPLLFHIFLILAWDHVRPLVRMCDFSTGGRLADAEIAVAASTNVDSLLSAFLARLLDGPTPDRLLRLKGFVEGD